MLSMNEALARERLRERYADAYRSSVASEVAAARRWHRLERRARAAHRRHSQRVHQVANSAVAESNWS